MMQTATPDQIKRALIDLAASRGRPEYEMFIVRQVLASFKEDKPHPLKAAVQVFINNPVGGNAKPTPMVAIKKPQPIKPEETQIDSTIVKKRLDRLKKICVKENLLRLLSVRTQLAEGLLKSILGKRTELTNNLWEVLEPEIIVIERTQHNLNGNNNLSASDKYWY